MNSGPDSAPITAADAAFLATYSGGNAAAIVADWDPVAARRQRTQDVLDTRERLLLSTVSVVDAARCLAVDTSEISRRLAARTLYSVSVGTGRWIPEWQFPGGKELPGLDVVVPAIPESAHPLEIHGLMTTPQDELDGRTPVEHLAGAGDPQLVADLLTALERW